jgi:predicted nucleic acid-binding protein
MRTTVTLDDDVVQLLRRRMALQQVSFKKALNDAVRDDAADRPAPQKFRTRTALAALAVEHRAGIVSYDSDFARFKGVRWNTPNELLS